MPMAPARIWMDVTTSLRASGGQTNGTLRVERGFMRELQPLLGDRLAFCRYDTARSRFEPADPPPLSVQPAKPQRGPGASNARSDRIGRRLERSVRLALRGLFKRVHGAIGNRDAASHFPHSARGDVLLLAGENWAARYDFDVIARLRREHGLQVVAVCQDVIPVTHPHFFEQGDFVQQYRRYVAFLARHVDLVIAISQATGNELSKAALAHGGMAGPIVVIELGSDVASAERPIPPALDPPLRPQQFVISVSTIQARKNFDLLYRVWRRFAQEGKAAPRLVIVGQRGFGGDALLAAIAGDASIKNSVTILHRASDAELTWLYRNCAFTLYPSFVEGWGLPVSESLGYGKLCIAANTSSLPEAGAGLAIHLAPDDDDAWHDAILGLSERPAQRAAAETRIRAEYRVRTWQAAGSELAAHLTALLDNSPHAKD